MPTHVGIVLAKVAAECPTVATPKQPCLVESAEPHGGGDPALSPPFFVCRGGPVWSVWSGGGAACWRASISFRASGSRGPAV